MRTLNAILLMLVWLSASGYSAQHDDLFSAAKDGDVSEVNRFLRDPNTEVTEQNKNGDTAIHIAVANGHLEVVEILLLNGVKVNIFNAKASTPLHIAASHGHTNIAEFLLRKKAYVNALDFKDDSPLNKAIENGHVRVVELLLYYGANLYTMNISGQMPTDIAHQSDISVLLNHAKQEKNAVRKMCGAKSSFSQCIQSELIKIAKKGDDQRRLFWLIRDHGVSPNFKITDDVELLHIAALNGHKDVVEGLLICNAFVDAVTKDNTTALHYAATKGHTKIADLLIRSGANIEAVDYQAFPLYHAAHQGHWEIVYLLLLNGADANQQRENGNTALHAATAEDHEETIKVLLQSNANRHLINANGKSPMDLATKNKLWMFQQIRSPAHDACAHYSVFDFQKDVHLREKRAADAEPAISFEFPWMAAIFYKNTPESKPEFNCGGTIISDIFVLTAAHCIEYDTKMLVRLGTEFIHDKNHTGQDYNVKEIIRPNYRKYAEGGFRNKNDIALLRLDRKIQFTNTMQPACLQTERRKDIDCNETYIVTGWGITENNKRPNRLLKIDLKILPNSDCASFRKEMKNNKFQLCAYDPEFKNDACGGDSGGPLQTFRAGSFVSTVVGVVSYGLARCPSMAPDIYAEVTYYLDWIQSHVWPEQTAMKNIDDKNFNNFDSGEYTNTLYTSDDKKIEKKFIEKTYGRYVQ